MAGHARLRFSQTHGRVFHVGCIASNAGAFPCISRDGVGEDVYQKVLAEVMKSRRTLGEAELTDADHAKADPTNPGIPSAGPAPAGSTILEPEQEAGCVEILDAVKFRDLFGHLRTKVEVPERARSEYGRLCNLILARCLEAVRRNDTVQAERQFKAWCLASTWTLAESSGPREEDEGADQLPWPRCLNVCASCGRVGGTFSSTRQKRTRALTKTQGSSRVNDPVRLSPMRPVKWRVLWPRYKHKHASPRKR